MHDCIKNRFVLECTIETLSPLHIGAERETGFGVDNPIVKVRGIPVIPGSSIKGILRSHFYRLANSGALKEIRLFNGNLEEFEKNFAGKKEEEKLEMLRNLGTLEKFFGISGLASPLRITDAEPKEYEIGTRTHIKIDPKTDRVEKGKLFTVEYVEGKFEFKVVFDELCNDYEDVNKFFRRYFFTALKNGMEIHLGGMRSRGYGFCLLKLEKAWRYTPEGLAIGKAEEWGGEDV